MKTNKQTNKQTNKSLMLNPYQNLLRARCQSQKYNSAAVRIKFEIILLNDSGEKVLTYRQTNRWTDIPISESGSSGLTQ